MAILYGKGADVQMGIMPHRVAEESEPILIWTKVELKFENNTLLSNAITLTVGDLDEIEALALVVVGRQREEAVMSTLDEDFRMEVSGNPGRSDVHVGFWVGEPYELMKGYRFVSSVQDVERFVRDLKADVQCLMLSREPSQ